MTRATNNTSSKNGRGWWRSKKAFYTIAVPVILALWSTLASPILTNTRWGNQLLSRIVGEKPLEQAPTAGALPPKMLTVADMESGSDPKKVDLDPEKTVTKDAIPQFTRKAMKVVLQNEGDKPSELVRNEGRDPAPADRQITHVSESARQETRFFESGVGDYTNAKNRALVEQGSPERNPRR